MLVRTGAAQHLGERENQEDSVGFSDFLNFRFIAHAGVVGVIADGMGGFEAGQEASRLAVDRFLAAYSEKRHDEPVRDALMRGLFLANDAILRIPAVKESNARVGTTFIAAAVHGRELHWVSVGDSRIFLVRGEKITQLTTDHTVATELQRKVVQRSMSQEDADSNPDRGILTSYVGTPDLTDIDCNIKGYPMQPNDVLILCTDGLYRTLTPEEIMTEVEGHPQDIAERLIRRVAEKAEHAQDNASAVVLYCEGNDTISDEARSLDGQAADVSNTARVLGILLVIVGALGLAFVLFRMKK